MKRFWLVLMLAAACCFTTTAVIAHPVFISNQNSVEPYHVILPGDNLTHIVRSYTPQLVQRLREENGMTGDRIYAGDLLKLPNTWFAPTPSVTTVPVTNPNPKEIPMNTIPFDASLLMTLLAFSFILLVIGAIVHLLMRSQRTPTSATPPAPHEHCGHHCHCYPHTAAPAVPAEIYVYVHHRHGFPVDGIPVRVTMTTPPPAPPATPPTS